MLSFHVKFVQTHRQTMVTQYIPRSFDTGIKIMLGTKICSNYLDRLCLDLDLDRLLLSLDRDRVLFFLFGVLNQTQQVFTLSYSYLYPLPYNLDL